MPARTQTGPGTAPAPTAAAAAAVAAGVGNKKTRRRASIPCGLNRRIHDLLTLLIFHESIIADIKFVHRGAHEAPQRVGRRADDGLAAHVERRIHDEAVTGHLLELAYQAIITRVRDGWYIRARYMHPRQSGVSLLLHQCGPCAPLAAHRRDQQHIRAITI